MAASVALRALSAIGEFVQDPRFFRSAIVEPEVQHRFGSMPLGAREKHRERRPHSRITLSVDTTEGMGHNKHLCGSSKLGVFLIEVTCGGGRELPISVTPS
jgi:hypothetical protein